MDKDKQLELTPEDIRKDGGDEKIYVVLRDACDAIHGAVRSMLVRRPTPPIENPVMPASGVSLGMLADQPKSERAALTTRGLRLPWGEPFSTSLDSLS